MRRPSTSRLMQAVLCGGLTLALAVFATRDAATAASASRNPELALTLERNNADALSASLDARLASSPSSGKLSAEAVSNIKSALRATPLHAGLLRSLGISFDARGNTALARPLLALSQSVSRRDLLGQLWLLEDAVNRGDVKEAMRHYDVALTTANGAQELLFPVLSSALSDPTVRSEISRYLSLRRPWADAFVSYAISNGVPRDVAEATRAAGLTRDPTFHSKSADLLAHFITAGDFAGARAFAAGLPGARRATFAFIGFTQSSVDPDFTPLTWRLPAEGEVAAILGPDSELQINATAGNRGVAATRIVFLAPGTYTFHQIVESPDQGAVSGAVWEWSCLNSASSRSIGQQAVTIQNGRTNQALTLTVPSNCDAIRVDLTVSADEAQDGQLTIRRVDLTPAAGVRASKIG